ncbi:hypothetical protein [Neobacillus jeddahensis]|uniref:hypothetical protein n=1 Tax=Neobacillus jeddahensis TaxID=1461580 RepID=UPI000590D49A|nr:hypothetical protein [Neobacillus jeddahensis]
MLPIEVENLKRSSETMNFVKALHIEFGLEYGKDYDMSIHITEIKRMINNTRTPWKLAYQLPNCIRLDDGNCSSGFLICNDNYRDDAFIKIVDFVANYLKTTYEKW